jgi:hypothetical protein
MKLGKKPDASFMRSLNASARGKVPKPFIHHTPVSSNPAQVSALRTLVLLEWQISDVGFLNLVPSWNHSFVFNYLFKGKRHLKCCGSVEWHSPMSEDAQSPILRYTSTCTDMADWDVERQQ